MLAWWEMIKFFALVGGFMGIVYLMAKEIR